MCGICGVVDYNNTKIEEFLLLGMSRLMQHRGPDNEGIYVDNRASGPNIGLGHRRLKIIDLSEAGHQPMTNEDGSIWLVLNGEIYNFPELKEELQAKGHLFKSNTDTETVIHLYEEKGTDCVNYLRGMFAFAIWDKRKETLMLARDRVGKKPLLYYYKHGKFCFASEFCALLASGSVSREINLEAIDYYLTFGYIPAPFTIYKDVFKLLPAHTLTLKDNTLILKKYWEISYNDKIKISEQEAAEEVLKLLREAVRVRLYSDVPLGAFLSGGVDSSTVVALMGQLSKTKVKTFSIGFEEQGYSELRYARNIAQRFSTDHHEFIVKPDALKILPLLVEHYGEPYADSSCIPTYYVSWQTKQYVTVALNGDGGDEVFAGYERYQAMLAAEKIPHMAKNIFSRCATILPDFINSRNIKRAKRFFSAVTLPILERYMKWVGIFDNALKRDMYSEELLKSLSKADSFKFIAPFLIPASGPFTIDNLLSTDTMTYLPNDLLVKVDITSMANSLEARSPFLDHKLMEFAAKLPVEYKMKGLVKKYLLKRAIKDLIPCENVNRRKMGFAIPIGEMFRNELRGFVYETLLSTQSLQRGYFKPAVIKEAVRRHMERKKDYTHQLWALLMLELWHKRFMS